MALPDGVLSSRPVSSPFLGGRTQLVRAIEDFETGGIALQDPSRGLQYQTWRARIVKHNTQIVLDAEQVPANVFITGNNLTEVSLTFDRNMRPAIAYVEDGMAKLYWYDAIQSAPVTTSYPGIITPRVSLDDKRPLQSAVSDVIFAYLKNNGLYYRQQRDRYQQEYLLQANINSPGLIKIGMNRQLRLQFLLRNP